MLVACRLLIDLNQISPDINLHIFRASIIESDQFANLNLQINRFSLASITSHASPSTNPFFLFFFMGTQKYEKLWLDIYQTFFNHHVATHTINPSLGFHTTNNALFILGKTPPPT